MKRNKILVSGRIQVRQLSYYGILYIWKGPLVHSVFQYIQTESPPLDTKGFPLRGSYFKIQILPLYIYDSFYFFIFVAG